MAAGSLTHNRRTVLEHLTTLVLAAAVAMMLLSASLPRPTVRTSAATVPAAAPGELPSSPR